MHLNSRIGHNFLNGYFCYTASPYPVPVFFRVFFTTIENEKEKLLLSHFFTTAQKIKFRKDQIFEIEFPQLSHVLR